jgi:ResB-like family
MREIYREFIRLFVSLRLTVVLLALSALLIFFATLDQVNLGIWAVQDKWFKSFIVLQKYKDVPVPVFPGGYFIGGLLLVNLVAAHIKRFAFTWKKAGIQLVHGGLILMLLGELVSGLIQEEYQLQLNEGETRNYSQSWRRHELAVIDATAPDTDVVTVIPESRLGRDTDIQVPALPFRVVPRAYYPNAHLTLKDQQPAGQAAVENLATTGLGPRFAVTPAEVTYDPDKKNWPAAFVEVVTTEGTLGTFLVSSLLTDAESFTYADHTWHLALRQERAYKPYSLTLLKVTNDVFPGTDIPKNFSSRIRINTPDGKEDREVLIYMNNPLRYQGLTFYQYQMDAAKAMTVLQVVRNPSWLIPYLSCLIMTAGLLWQFCSHLIVFFRKRAAAPAAVTATRSA